MDAPIEPVGPSTPARPGGDANGGASDLLDGISKSVAAVEFPSSTHQPDLVAETTGLVDASSSVDKKGESDASTYPDVGLGQMLCEFSDGTDNLLVFLGTLGAVIQGAAMPAFSFIFAELLEGLMHPSPIEASKQTMANSWLFLWVAFGIFACTTLNVGCFEMVAERQLIKYRRAYFKAVLRQDIAWFDKTKTLELPSSLSGDTTLMRDGIGMKLGNGVMGMATFILSYVFAFFRGWQLTLVMLAVMPVMAIISGIGATLVTTMTKKAQESYATAGGIAEEHLGNMRTVAAFAGEEDAIEKFNKEVTDAKVQGMKGAHAAGLNFGLMMFVMFGSYFLGFWYGGTLITDVDRLTNNWTGLPWTGGDVMAVFFATLMGGMMLGQMGPTAQATASAKGAAGKMFSIHRNTPSIDPDQKGEQPSTCDGTFTFEDVKFRYPSRPDVPLFEGLTLSIQKGKTTALVGESGSGKSTIMALLQRFYDVERGTIKLDGVDLRQLDQRWLRSNIGLVAQEPVLFATTIRKNILFGKPDASDQDVEDAAKAANAHDFIMKFDDGYDTYVGEKGSQISGGQKQRIAIARALLHRPKILLLDEATSALDNQSQKEVQGTIDKIMADESRQLTCVVIAHRLSTIYNADAICVFEHGKKVQEGTHTQLAAESDGLYARLIADQEKLFAGAEAAGGGGKKSAADHVVSEVVATDTTGVAPKEDKKDEEEKEKCYTTADILKETGKSGKPLMGLGLLAAVAAGCALPLWALFFADVTKAFYCCPPWDPNLMLNLVDNTTGALNLVDGKITGTATIDGVVFERAVSPQEYQIMTTNAAKGLMVYGLEEPTLYGVFADFDSCTSMQTDKINFWAFMFLVLGAVLGISEYFKAFAWGAMACTVTMNLRKKYFKGVIYKEIGFFDETEHTSGNLTSRLAADTQLVSGALGPSIGAALQSMATLILGMILAFTGGWQLALALLGFMPLMTISAKIQNDLIFGLSGKEQDGLGAANQVASESIQGIRTVRSFGMENEVLELYESLCTDKENDGNRHIKTAVVSGIATGLSQFLMFALYWVAFLYGGYLIKHAGYSGSDVMQTFMAIMMAAFGIAMANMAVPDVGKSAAAAEGIFSTLQRMSLIDASETGKQDREFDGTVHFEGVNFAYPSRVDRPILKNVNLLIEKGKTTALVGPSGSGKSTIVSLIQRFYDPTKGSVQTSSGVKLSDMDVKWWRTQIGVVGQEPVLFKGSILDNISRGKPGCSRAEVEDAAKRAYAHGFIMKSCPDGYDTDVGERGSVLSGGQKQRIAIARALIRHPKILLLDEATSALDNQSEKEVQEAIDNIIATEQMTCVVIAHRLNTIVGADKIVVFEQGCIVQTGTHQSLLAEEGLYAELAAR